MSKKNTILEINGQRYDANTGVVLPVATGRHLDGVKSVRSGVSQPRRPHAIAKTAAAHPRQSSRTLMRQSVHKPAESPKKYVKTSHSLAAGRQTPPIAPKASVRRINAQRAHRAKRVARSQQISRFQHHDLVTRPASVMLPVVEHAGPLLTSPPRRIDHKHQPRTTADLLELALQQSTCHTEKLTRTQRRFARSRRITSVSAVSLSMLFMIGFVAYQNILPVKLQFASARAGFSVALPDKQPDGYRLSHLNYQQGLAAFDFHSNTDDRAYSIVEKASAWDSQALRDSIVATAGQHYQTQQQDGRTVYYYGQQTATWVDGGVWYTVHGNGSLSEHQLTDMVASL